MGDSLSVFDYVKKYLPKSVTYVLDEFDEIYCCSLTEIRIRRNMPVIFVINNIPCFADKYSVITKILPKSPLIVDDADFDEMLNAMCEYSFYSKINTMKNGFITLENGSRVGICSTAVYDDGGLVSVKDVSSVAVRIPRQAVGCGAQIVKALFSNGLCSSIVAGKPSSGKTTLLRDMARELSSGFNSRYCKVTVVDERNELAGKVGKAFTLDVGVNTDVITGFEKAMAIETAIRTLSPDVIVCDEVSTLKEAQSIKFGFSCGVHFLLSVHIGSFDDLYRRTVLRELLESGFFKKIILLYDSYTAKIIDCGDIYDEADRKHIDNFFLADGRNYHGE